MEGNNRHEPLGGTRQTTYAYIVKKGRTQRKLLESERRGVTAPLTFKK